MEVLIIILIGLVLGMGMVILNIKNSKPTQDNYGRKSVGVGSVGICSKQLYHHPNGKKEEFYVTYELEVIATSESKLKVKVLDFSSGYTQANDPSNKGWITKVVDNGWIYKSEFELADINNTQQTRDKKLNQILRLLSMGYKQLECIVYAGDSVKNIVDFNKPYEIKFYNHPSLPNGNYIDTSKYKPCRFEKFEDCLYAINQQREFEKKNKIINPFGVGQKSTDIFSILLRYKFIG